MPHMMAQEHMGYVDAIRFGTARTNVTLAAALSFIGSSPATLVPTFAGDGAWTISANMTIPANVTLEIPAGTTINVATGVILALNGPLISHNPNWKTGPGAVTRGLTMPVEITAVKSSALTVPSPPGSGGVKVVCVQSDGSALSPEPSTFIQSGDSGGNVVPFINLIRDPATPTANWTISNNLTNMFHVSHPGGQAYFAVTNTGSWFGTGAATPTPTHLLQLSAGDAFMPGGGAWGNSTSDARLKKNVRDFTMGLAVALQLVAKYYEYNGLGETIDDGKEYIGFVADDIVGIVPHMVGHDTSRKLHPDDPTTTDFYTLNESSLVYILLNAVKEQQALIEALSDRIEVLETARTARTSEAEAEDEPAPRQTRRRPRH